MCNLLVVYEIPVKYLFMSSECVLGLEYKW